MHTLKNIELGRNNRRFVFETLTDNSQIKNLKIESMTQIKNVNSTLKEFAFIGTTNGATLDQIHFDGVDLTGSYIAPLIYSMNNSMVTNCSAKNVTLNDKNGGTYAYLGGLVAGTNQSKILNCYTQNINITSQYLTNGNENVGLGGIAAVGSLTNIENCYSQGKIEGQRKLGGIFGDRANTNGRYCKIQHCWSDVTLEIHYDDGGGITGTGTYDNLLIGDRFIRNNLVLGNILVTNASYKQVHRIAGVSSKRAYHNFAYEKQSFNNDPNYGLDDADGFLSNTDLSSEDTYLYRIGLGNAYDYSVIQNGQLPLLKSTKGELLPYQEPNYFDKGDNSFSIESATRLDNTDDGRFQTILKLQHPGYEYVGTKIDGMIINDTKIQKIDESSSRITLTSNKENAFDSYKITVVVKSKQGTLQQEMSGIVEYAGGPVYWNIDTVSTLKSVLNTGHKDSFENFKITHDLDFEDGMEFGDLKVNRFVGTSSDITIKNIDSNYTSAYDYKNFISIADVEIKDLTFENCYMNYSSNSLPSNLGIIGLNRGSIENVIFRHCEVNATHTSTSIPGYLGMVGNQIGNVQDVQGIDLQIEVNGTFQYVGGIFGYCAGVLKNVSLCSTEGSDHPTKIIAVRSNIVGGIAGYVSLSVSTQFNENIFAKDITVEGDISVGGIFGRSDGSVMYRSIYINDSNITGNMNVGGLSGFNGNYKNLSLVEENINDGYTAKNLKVTGQIYVGGVVGLDGKLETINVTDLTVKATERIAGGLRGQGYNDISYSTVHNTNVTAKYAAGGISGSGIALLQNNVIDSKITATEKYAGGLVGTPSIIVNSDGTIDGTGIQGINDPCRVINTKVTAKEYAGGLFGYKDNGYGTYTYVVKDCNITADNYVGGFFGATKNWSGSGGIHMTNSYVAGTTVTARENYAGGLVGYMKYGNNYDFCNGYVFADVKANDYAGGLVGGTDDECPINGTFSKIIVNVNVETNGSHAHIIANNYDELKTKAKLFEKLKVVETSTINGQPVQAGEVDGTIVSVIPKKQLSDNQLYSDLSMYSDYWTLASAAADVKDLIVLQNGNWNECTIGVLGSTYSGPAHVQITKNGKTQDIDTVLTNGTANIVFNIQNNYTNLPLVFTLTVGDQSWTRNFSGYYGSNKYFDSETDNHILETGDTITLPTGHEYTWYHCLTPWYSTTDNTMKYQNYTGNELEVKNRGYYFAVNEEGAYSPMFFVNGTGYMPYNRIPSGSAYPYQAGKDENGNYYPTDDFYFYGGIELERYEPEQPLGDGTSTVQGLPEFDVYASGVDSINVELDSDGSEDYNLLVETKDSVKSYPMKTRVMTLSYDFMEDMTLTLESEDEQKTKAVDPMEVRKTVSVYDEHYYYLIEDGIVSDNKTYDLNGIHLYEDKALLEDGTVYDLHDDDIYVVEDNGNMMDSRALVSDELNGYQIDTYQNFTQINGEDGESRNLRMYVKNGKLYAIDGTISMPGNAVIVDEYQGHKIQTQLGEDGRLMNYMDSIKVPKGFRNENIKEMTHTLSGDSSLVFVRYEDGDLDAFNYLNGERMEVEDMKKEPTFLEFVENQFNALFSSDVDQMDDRYQASFELQKELRIIDKEVQKELKQYQDESQNKHKELSPIYKDSYTQPSDPYVTLYDEKSDSYQTYNVETLLASSDDARISENEKLQKLKEQGKTINIQDELVSPKKHLDDQSAEIGFGVLTISIIVCLGVILKKRKQLLGKVN